ncbi:arylsulfatase [Rubrivivax gelatinosus]|uniref:Sulfatase n=1 Tax=Rubrivivax gelatinosus TaxID=28068 RepID=A0ABS1E0M8_RUBGE|nr:arylsulfatase [Rubrivivax gelatinosus]MBK1715010.1 sulfatase [Rubrivivax gelatinosus]
MKTILHTAVLVGGALNAAGAAPAAQAAPAPSPAAPSPGERAGAPNVVWILLDDVGFGASSAFGGLIETPNLEALAAQGLRYTNFHTTAISSPTRAALLTGRNHHSVGLGLFPETANDQPGYNGRIPPNKGTVAEVLRSAGYSTIAVGKWHLAPVAEASAAGPFTGWPTGKGFERYFGFLYGETDQWAPQLVEDTHVADLELRGRHLNEILTDRAIRYVANAKTLRPDQPFFLYYAPGATHAPHQVAPEWISHYKGRFDAGWDDYRERTFARQRQLGVVPAQARLPPRNPRVPAWDTLGADQKKLYARYFETYAGFLSYTDAEIGRLVDFLKRSGQFDNTVFAIVVGDNGASKEGTDAGTISGLGSLLAPAPGIAEELARIDEIGSKTTSPNYPLGWAQATNTPYRQWKQDANAEGGTRNPLILVAPGLRERGGVREQFGHVIDLLPTTLELAQVPAPKVIAGVEQAPFEGVSLAASVADRRAPSPHRVQYFEINGTRAIYAEGWKASTLHEPGTPFEQDRWELYDLGRDPTELEDLAAREPARLAELKALFDSEARKYQVYPLKDTLFTDFASRHSVFGARRTIELLPGIDPLFSSTAPNVATGAFEIVAEVVIPERGAQGVLLANGGRFGGGSLYVQGGRLHYAQTNGRAVSTVSSEPLAAGPNRLRLVFRTLARDKAQVQLFAGERRIGEGTVPLTFGLAYFSYDESFDVGRDLQTAVTPAYAPPFAFDGRLDKVTVRYPQ